MAFLARVAAIVTTWRFVLPCARSARTIMAICFAFQAVGATISNQTSSALADLCTAEQRFEEHAVQVHAIGGGGGVDLRGCGERGERCRGAEDGFDRPHSVRIYLKVQ